MGWVRVLVAVAVVAVGVTACSAGSRAPQQPEGAIPATYYLALGDSLAQGVQPDASGTSVETGQGYPDQLYAILRRSEPGLRLVKLGCPGETTGTMIHGGICRYAQGSQLAAAVAFLAAHRGQMSLVTIDIGANDPEACGSVASIRSVASCAGADFPQAVSNLTTILTRLQAAGGAGIRMVGMNYYLPALAVWRSGPAGRALARVAERLAAGYNDLLDRAYAAAGVAVANVFGAFSTSDFGHDVTVAGVGTVPRNVALICQWTWECASPRRGPNQHANQTGYAVIARAFLSAAGAAQGASAANRSSG